MTMLLTQHAMIVHVVPENARGRGVVQMCFHAANRTISRTWNTSRTLVQCLWRPAGDGRTIYIYIIYRLRTFNSSMWGSLRLAPISIH